MGVFDSVPREMYDQALSDRRVAETRLDQVRLTMIDRKVHEQTVEHMQRQIDLHQRDQRIHYVAREVHDQAVAGLQRQLDLANESLRDARTRLDVLTTETMAIKRHDLGMIPSGFDAKATDPMNGLGPKTQAAIDEWADGNRDTRNFLIHQAHMRLGDRKSVV